MRTRPGRGALAALLLTLVVAGCSTLPTSGIVHTRPDQEATAGIDAPYFEPPGPIPGTEPEDVVRGFLLAMQANPPSTTVARSFLSAGARATWKPVNGTIVYDASDFETVGDMVTARLSNAHRLDPHGVWDTGSTASTALVRYHLVQEHGQWRIDNPPNALAVPSSYFPSIFAPYHLYFFDRTGTVLVPVRVYLPRGEQTASNLVRGLLAGPPGRDDGVITSAFPSQTNLDLAVLVSDAGVAEVPLNPGILRLGSADLGRALVQLSWTLRQVPGITRIRLTVDGVNVPLPDGQSDVGTALGQEFDPLAMPDHDLVAVAGGRVVRIDARGAATRIGGPLGKAGFALRSVALDAVRHRVAAVAANGERLYVAADDGATAQQRVRVAVGGGTDLLRPVFDRFGSLWTVDDTAHGAVVHVSAGGNDRVVAVPGISGQHVVAFTVTRDGTRFVAAYAGSGVPELGVAGLIRRADGRVASADDAELVTAGEQDLGTVRDVGQIDETTLGVLVQPAHGSGRLVHVELDGSPGPTAAATPDVVPGVVAALVAAADPALPMRVVTTDHHLLLQDESGQWTRSPLADILDAAYPG